MKTNAPLSKTQYGLYAECVSHQGEACYNIPYLYTFDASLDAERLCRAVESAVAAHPTLFTRIALTEEGEPLQTIDHTEHFTLSVESVTDIKAEAARFVQPFNLVGDRLFRIRLLRDTDYLYLLQDIHHIISDGASRRVLLADIEKAYQGGSLQPEERTLADVASEEAALAATPTYDTDKKWYAEQFDCGDLYSPLLSDMVAGTDYTAAEGRLRRVMHVDAALVEAFCKEHGIYKSTFFTSAYAFLLARFNNEQQALFATIHNGRSDRRLTRSVAMLVKTVPVYQKFTDDTTVVDFLKAGQDQMTGCRQHEAYAYSDALHDLELQIATMFAWHGTLFDSLEFSGKEMGATRLNNNSLEVPIYLKAYSRDGHYEVEAEYAGTDYSEALVQQFLASYEAVVRGFVSTTLLRDISIVNEEQLALLDSFNQNEVAYDDTQTIVSLFRQQARALPDNIAVVFGDKRYTYAEVDELSDRIAGCIASKGLGLGDVVSVLIPRCEWMAIASLGILKAGCAYQPLDPSYPKERLNFMMQDACAKLLIADEQLRPIVDEYTGDVLLTKDLAQCAKGSQQPAEPIPESLLILLYTSGSTGVPKGCQLTHANLVAFCHWYQRYYALKPEHHVAAYASYGFDACMMDMYPALTCGATVYIVAEEIRLDLIALNEYFEREHITHSFMTTQVGYQFATSIENHSLLHLSTGGEKLASLTPPQGYHFYNGYGPTECTIFTTTYLTDKKLKEIPIGKPVDNMRLYIVDAQGHRLPVGAAGELWISGPQVSRGYLNRPEKTAEVYIANPFTDDKKFARIYRSGDIVRYLPDGNIQFVGRSDGQVKIRGFRIELKEVEAVIREFKGIKDATVQAFDEEGGNGKFIAAYIVSDEQVDIEALNNFILDQKPPYMVPAVTMQIDAIPLNQNQKVNKRALPKPEKKAAVVEETNVPMNVLEQELHNMIAAIVGNQEFGISTVLGYAGLTSISAIKLAVQVNKHYGVKLDSKALVKTGTLQAIENEILKQMMAGKAPATEAKAQADGRKSEAQADSPKTEAKAVPLSYAQTGVYLDCLKNPTTTLYNIPTMLGFPRNTDTTALAEAVRNLVSHHRQMTVHFGNDGSDIVQMYDDGQTVEIAESQMTEDELATYKNQFVKPFDLSTGPLYRFEIVTTAQHICLLADVHHLVFDGGSLDLFLSQLCDLMNGNPIEDEDQSYADYVTAEKAAEGGADYQAAQEWFKSQLSMVEAATEVQPDLKDPAQGTIGIARAGFDIEAFNTFCRNHNITPAHLILAATYYALSRFANSEQLCITTVSSGRSNLSIRNTVGMFVNTLALSATIGKQTVSDFLQEVSTNFDETLRHENYPFAQIAADYGLSAEIQFVYQLGVINKYVCQGSALELESLELKVPKFPITLFIRDIKGQACISVEYDNGKYSARLMQSLADAIKVTAERMIARPDAALTSISIVNDEEAERIIKMGTGKDIDVDLSKTFANLFTEQARRTPDAPAVVDKDSQLTYGEMDRYSNALARQLIDFGVQPNDFVCVMLDRTKEFPLAVLSIHKAAAAYTPLDFEYPNERLSYMLENSESKVLITSHQVLEAKFAEGDFSTAAAQTFFIDDFMQDVPKADPIDLSNPEGLAYMIYTSGSTGKPKGAMLHQAGLRNFIAVVIDMEKLTAADRISGHRSFSFDAHIEDMYPVLTLGGSFHIMPMEIRKDLALIRQFLIDHQITGGGYSTAMTCLLLNAFDDLPIRFTTGGGEKMSGVFSDHIEIINVYGPTECTDDTSYYSIAPGRHVEDIPIGQSVANNWNFIVDSSGNLVPQGVAGELCFAGIQVGRGYWRLPERTATSFVECPFVKEDRWGRPVRMYHTGDLCRWNEEGQIEFMGRIDTQVKLRGFRIELGEIENKALNIEGIRQAAAEVRKVMGNEHLVLYYTMVEGSTITDEDIRQALAASSLADYMVPDAYMRLDVMPMTPNLKINRKALPTPVLKRATEFVAPEGETETLFCRIFSEVLKIEEVGATDNFFEIGGTSINAIKVIVEASKGGVQIVFNDLFTLKTPRALAEFVQGGQQAPAPSATPAEAATAPTEAPASEALSAGVQAVLAANTLDAFRNGEQQPIGNVLLTGATGYLGMHILNELLCNTESHILCPIRAKGDNEALSRLKTMFYYYFGRTSGFSHFDERVTAFAAEVTEPDALNAITEQGLTVVNCVANVKHFSAGNDIEMVNIESVRHLISFCLRTASRLIHVSTNSIAGLSVNGKPGPEVTLSERDLWLGQDINANKYVYSKYKAEELVLDSIAHHGLNAKIMRVGNLSARQHDGEFQINFNTNNFLAMLRAYVVLGMVPYDALERRFEFSPIDEVAHVIILLAQTPRENVVFHPYNIRRQYLADILNGFAEAGITLPRVEPEEFQKAVEQTMENPDLVMLLRPLMAYKTSGGNQTRWIESTNSLTTQVLYRMGFQWPTTAADYVHRFVDTIVGFGFFNVE